MFGFGKSAELQKREEALARLEKECLEREKTIQQREFFLLEEAQRIKQRFAYLRQRETELERKERFLNTKENELRSMYQQLGFERTNFLNEREREARGIIENAKGEARKEAQKILAQAYQKGISEGRLEGLTSGKKDYRQLERERDTAIKRAKNAKFAAIRRKKKEEAEKNQH